MPTTSHQPMTTQTPSAASGRLAGSTKTALDTGRGLWVCSTDGSYKKGIGGWAVSSHDGPVVSAVGESLGSDECEIRALALALEVAPVEQNLFIFCDSLSVVERFDWLLSGDPKACRGRLWKNNQPHWEHILQATTQRGDHTWVVVKWVRGHQPNSVIHKAHTAARNAMRTSRSKIRRYRIFYRYNRCAANEIHAGRLANATVDLTQFHTAASRRYTGPEVAASPTRPTVDKTLMPACL